MSFDWSKPIPEQEDNGEYLLPEGTWKFDVEEAKINDDGIHTANIRLKLNVYCRNGGNDHNGMISYQNLYLTEKAIFQVKNFAKCLGIDKPNISAPEVVDQCLGCDGTAEFYTDNYNGEKRTKVKKWIFKPQKDDTSVKDEEDLPW